VFNVSFLVNRAILSANSKAFSIKGMAILSAPSAPYRRVRSRAAWIVVSLGSPVASMSQSLFASARKA
jgi:hypothetical protein